MICGCLHVAAQTSVKSRAWFRREYQVKETNYPIPVHTEKTGLKISAPVDFSRTNEFFCKLREGWSGAFNELECEITFPEDFPVGAQLYFSGKDWDNLWYNYKAEIPKNLKKPVRFRLPLIGKSAQTVWVPGRHKRPWHQLTARQLREFGFKLESPKGNPLSWSGMLTVRLNLVTNPTLDVESIITNLQVNKTVLNTGETYEVSFEVPFLFKSPFNPDDVKLIGDVSIPGGLKTTVQCFYYEDFHFDGTDEFSKLIPAGHPQFRLRFTPSVPGLHTVDIRGIVGRETLILPPLSFTVQSNPKAWKGFVQRMPNNTQLLSYSETDEEFWGLGLNVRSPFDTRYQDVFPATKWEPYNLNMYKRLFKTYKENGISIVEVWMSSWWLGLEWIPDAPGNHGIGYMNQWRAWKLDRLLEWAKEYDIHIILAIHNHGKFSTWCDQEWDRNPYNIENGGYLASPDQFFTHAKAKEDYYHFADYMIARWAHSPQIMAWKLFTEIDLTGIRQNDYRRPSVAYWHRATARYIKSRDPYKHLITTHWSTDVYKAKASPLLASAPELDILTLDAYYNGRHNLEKLYTNLVATKAFQTQIRKPCIITEFGGTPWADSIPVIRQQLHYTMWYGFFAGFPAAPFLWWFPLIEEQNLYYQFSSLWAFSKGEARANCFFGQSPVHTGVADNVEFYQVRDKTRMLGWVVDHSFYFTNKQLHKPGTLREGLTVLIEGLARGRYQVDFYDCRTGKVLPEKTTYFNNSTSLSIPTFRRDIAFKVNKID